MEIPVYFNFGLDHHRNFPYFFNELNYFGDKEIKVLHLGAYTGHGTRWILENSNASCVDVDTWAGSKDEDGHLDGHEFYDDRVERMYDEQTAGLPTTKFKGTTLEFFAQNKETFDFIYIDASHKKSDVALDLEESFKILNSGGVIACDDYLWTMYLEHVERDLIPQDAIDEFVSANDKKIEVIVNNYQLWFKKI
jgi:hypothetical protein